MLNLKNSFSKLPNKFFANVNPAQMPDPIIILFNENLSQKLNLNSIWLKSQQGLDYFTGRSKHYSPQPIAMVYAGHQFGSWVPQLGDGRAILLGEILDKQKIRWDIQVKGSGQTPFSRSGDGRAALGPVLREYLISEAMYSLGIPSTRSLSAIMTGEQVIREKILKGALITRVAKSHIRIGTFQYFASRGDVEAIKQLSDYVINRSYPEIFDKKFPYLELLKKVIDLQAKLIAQWMSVSFIHGVMNTDNVSIVGETIDYGPCAFMNQYDPKTVFSSIDTFKRYSYGNQPLICHWNLSQLASSLLPIISSNTEKSLKLAQFEIDKFSKIFDAYWINFFGKKIGIKSTKTSDKVLIQELLGIMEKDRLDFTLTFSSLKEFVSGQKFLDSKSKSQSIAHVSNSKNISNWLTKWKKRLLIESSSLKDKQTLLSASNPSIIPRNHLVEEAINYALENNMDKFNLLLKHLRKPYNNNSAIKIFKSLPEKNDDNFQTFCGT